MTLPMGHILSVGQKDWVLKTEFEWPLELV